MCGTCKAFEVSVLFTRSPTCEKHLGTNSKLVSLPFTRVCYNQLDSFNVWCHAIPSWSGDQSGNLHIRGGRCSPTSHSRHRTPPTLTVSMPTATTGGLQDDHHIAKSSSGADSGRTWDNQHVTRQRHCLLCRKKTLSHYTNLASTREPPNTHCLHCQTPWLLMWPCDKTSQGASTLFSL